MTPNWFLAIPLVVSLGAAAVQQADIRNAQVETRDMPIERTLSALDTAADPVWVGWQVPMVSGLRDLCGTWSDGVTTIRGAVFEDGTRPLASATAGTPAPVAHLEAGTALLVWIRVVNGRVERLRLVSDDCPVDGGGRRLIWLSSVTSGDSVRFLDALLTPALPSEGDRRRATAAVMGIALHADAAADVALDRLLTPTADTGLRNSAATWTARARGARGFAHLTALVGQESTDVGLRRIVAAALAQTRHPDTLGTLWRIAETDSDDQVRAQALGGYAELAPESEVSRVGAKLANEPSDVVRQRAVRGLARRATAVPLLVSLARSSTDKVVRTEAVRALSHSSDPAAIAYLTEVLK